MTALPTVTITESATGIIMEGTEIIVEAITAVTDTTHMVVTAVAILMAGITMAITRASDITRTTPPFFVGLPIPVPIPVPGF